MFRSERVNGDENIYGDGGERKAGNLRSDIRGGSEAARRRITQTSNQQPQPQNPMPQRDHRIILTARSQEREARDRVGKGGEEGKKRKKPHKSLGAMRETGGTWAETGENVDKKVLVP